MLGGGLLLVAIALAVLLWPDGDDDERQSTAATTTTSTSAPTTETSAGPEATTTVTAAWQAHVDAILRLLELGETITTPDLLDALGGVADLQQGGGTGPLGETPDFIVPLDHAVVPVSIDGVDHRLFVWRTAAPGLLPGVQWGLGVARQGAPFSPASGDGTEFLPTWPHSDFYYFEPAAGSGPLTRLDPVNGYAPLDTTGRFAADEDLFAMLLPASELGPGGEYAVQGFFRDTPEGATPGPEDPTAWTAFTQALP